MTQASTFAPGSMLLSVVSHGHGSMLARLLGDIERGWDKTGLRVVVTVNVPEELAFSPDDYSFPLQLIHNDTPRGFAANHNAAFRSAPEDLLCVVNPDVRCVVDPLPALLAALNQPGVALAAPVVVAPGGTVEDSARRIPTPGRILRRMLPSRRGPDYVIGDSVLYPDWVAGMFMLIRADVFRALGGFDERYHLYCEDADLCMRVWRSGHRVALVPTARITHDARRSSHRRPRFLVWHVRSLLRFFSTYPFYRPT